VKNNHQPITTPARARLGVVIILVIANFSLLAAKNIMHAAYATMKTNAIQWIVMQQLKWNV
jgi:hypothetical protein